MDPTNSSVTFAASALTSPTSPPTQTTLGTSRETLSVARALAPRSDTPKKRDEDYFANWICGEFDMKFLSHDENEDLRAAEKAKLSVKELAALGFTEPY